LIHSVTVVLDLDALLAHLNRHLPTIFMTGDQELARTTRMRRTGATCLTKPLEDETLVAAIGEAIARPHS